MNDPLLGPLDYVYAPSTDVAADAKRFVETLGAELVFAIDRSGTRVAMLRFTDGPGPAIVLTDHLPDERPIFLYRVASLADAEARLRSSGWTPDRSLELMMGPVSTFIATGGLRLGVYELVRPGVVESMAGQRDF